MSWEQFTSPGKCASQLLVTMSFKSYLFFNNSINERWNGLTCVDLGLVEHCKQATSIPFLPCCIECRRSLAMRILSVRLSVKRLLRDKMEERSVQIFISNERSFSLVF